MELVIMAGGIGSRFGGLKQISSVDENQNFIIDYSIFDAIRSGFDKIVIVISKENYEIFKSTIGKRASKKVKIKYVFQSNDGLNLNISKPLGTGYAVLLTKNEISNKFAVINADDFYGIESFKCLYESLTKSDENFCSTIFKLKNTLSINGNVTRGIANIQNENLIKITESEIKTQNNKIFARNLLEPNFYEINENTPVSMNMFGFNKKIFEFLENDFKTFLNNFDSTKNKEFFLPSVVTNAIDKKQIQVKVNKTDAKWLGLTYKSDLENVKENIKKLKRLKKYPENLWE